jgi:serine/threonine protein kinase
VNLLCPACHTPLPPASAAVVTCPGCAAEVDVTRAGTVAGKPRFVPEIDRTGTTVGGYRVTARLAGGGMGTVYRATGPEGRGAGKQVAIKFLSPALAQNSEVVARFAREIAMLARLDHPAIVRVRAHGAVDGIPWFAMDLVEGIDLRARLARGPLPPPETAAIFARLLAALAFAHDAGVVHRDLKPANLLLASDGARLADFGVARWDAEMLAGSAALTRLTETAAVIGTLPYMSPEQRRGGAVDRRSDLFSTGVMLYEVATGALPQGAFPPPSELNRAYGRAFDRVVLRLLQPDPARRPSSAEEAAASLAAALQPRAARLVRYGTRAAVLIAMLAGAGAGARAVRHLSSVQSPTDVISAPYAVLKAKVALPPQPNPLPPLATTPPPDTAARPTKSAKKPPKLSKKGVPESFARSKLVAPLDDDLGLGAKDPPQRSKGVAARKVGPLPGPLPQTGEGDSLKSAPAGALPDGVPKRE